MVLPASSLPGESVAEKWKRLGPQWQARFTMEVAGHGINKGGHLQVGCVPCAFAKVSGRLASFPAVARSSLQSANFERHSQLTSHRRSVDSLDSYLATGRTVETKAPAANEFKTFWRTHRSTSLGDHLQQDQSFRKKGSKMRYCLAEAVRDRYRRFLSTASSMTLTQDGSDGRQLYRFCAAGGDAQVCSGVMGLVRCAKGSHKGILEAKELCYKRLATKHLADTAHAR